LRSTKATDPPQIHANYFSDEADIAPLLEGVKIARKIAQAKAFDELRGPEIAPKPTIDTDDEIKRYIRDSAIGLFHPVGTCMMGTDPKAGAVVDPHLRVHGIKGLRIVDASIMPVITSGNPNASTVMIAEKAADLIKSEVRQETQSDLREEVLVRYGLGVGKLRPDKKGITFQVAMFKLSGEPDGQLVISSETIAEGPEELLTPPPNPNVQLDDPNPIEQMPTKSFGKGLWAFPDGSTLTALGVGNSNIENLTGGDVLTTEALAMVITNGTGRYEGARGLWTANRSVLNPPGGTLIGSEGEFRQRQIHTIRVVRGVDLDMP